MPITGRTRDVALAATAWTVAALAGCAPQPAPAPVVAHSSTWRVVVWGGSDDVDVAARTAIADELLRRGIATAIVPGAGVVDHILDVSITPEAAPAHAARARKGRGHKVPPPAPPAHLVADETVSEGHDAALVPERSFHTDAPPADLPPALANDPPRALAFAIGEALAPVAPTSAPAKPVVAHAAH